MSHIAPQVPITYAGATRNVAVSFSNELDTGELLTGTPTVVEITSSDLTLGSKAVSTADLEINGETCPTGEAVQFSVSGMVSGTTYKVSITVSTDATPAQTLVTIVEFTTETTVS